MAKISKGFSATKATLFIEGSGESINIKLVEEDKEGVNVFDFMKILKEWHGIEGISVNISLKENIEPDETEI